MFFLKQNISYDRTIRRFYWSTEDCTQYLQVDKQICKYYEQKKDSMSIFLQNKLLSERLFICTGYYPNIDHLNQLQKYLE
jgi:hypothetical protein